MKNSGNRKRHISVDDYLARLDDEVFDHQDFQRHIEETAHKLGMPVDVVDSVVKDFFRNFLRKVMKINSKQIVRLIVPGWLHVDIVEESYLKRNNLKIKKDAKSANK